MPPIYANEFRTKQPASFPFRYKGSTEGSLLGREGGGELKHLIVLPGNSLGGFFMVCILEFLSQKHTKMLFWIVTVIV